jgi:hypothetical protein
MPHKVALRLFDALKWTSLSTSLLAFTFTNRSTGTTVLTLGGGGRQSLRAVVLGGAYGRRKMSCNAEESEVLLEGSQGFRERRPTTLRNSSKRSREHQCRSSDEPPATSAGCETITDVGQDPGADFGKGQLGAVRGLVMTQGINQGTRVTSGIAKTW